MLDAIPSGRVRTLFVSDLHLGSPHSQVESFLRLLGRYRPERLYFVGDIVDGLRLKKRWLWNPRYGEVLARTSELARGGTRIYYAPGNHDDFLRPFVQDLGCIRIADEFVHVAADGGRYFVAHGDKYDGRDGDSPFRRYASGVLYDSLLVLNPAIDRFQAWVRSGDAPTRPFSASFKTRFRRAAKYVDRFERRLTAETRRRDCDGVICGHVHVPAIVDRDGLLYCNAGDWVEHSTALVEDDLGAMTLLTVESNRRGGATIRPFDERFAGRRPRYRGAVRALSEQEDDLEFDAEPAGATR